MVRIKIRTSVLLQHVSLFYSPQSLSDMNMELAEYLLTSPVKLLAALDKALLSAQDVLKSKLPEKDQASVVEKTFYHQFNLMKPLVASDDHL